MNQHFKVARSGGYSSDKLPLWSEMSTLRSDKSNFLSDKW